MIIMCIWATHTIYRDVLIIIVLLLVGQLECCSILHIYLLSPKDSCIIEIPNPYWRLKLLYFYFA